MKYNYNCYICDSIAIGICYIGNMNALLDYGSSSSDSDEDSIENERSQVENTKPKLPKPTIGETSLQTSVFSNPFVEAELAKAAILEKHVKMVYVDFLSQDFLLCYKLGVI